MFFYKAERPRPWGPNPGGRSLVPTRRQCMPRQRFRARKMAHPHRLGAYPSHDDGSFPLLVLFDDSLHNRWAAAPEGLQPEFDSAIDVGRLRGGHHVPCGQSIRATFKQPGQALMLRASDPMVVSNVTAPLLLSLAFTLPTGRPTCAPTPVRGRCDGSAACVSLRLRGTAAADTVFVPHDRVHFEG